MVAPLTSEQGKVKLRVLVDRGSVEVFGNDGQVALSKGASPGSLANVLYGAGGYSFTVGSPRLSLQFGMDCQLK